MDLQTVDWGGGAGGADKVLPGAIAPIKKKSPGLKSSWEDEQLRILFPDPIEYLAAKAASVSERQQISGPLDDAECVISSKKPIKLKHGKK